MKRVHATKRSNTPNKKPRQQQKSITSFFSPAASRKAPTPKKSNPPTPSAKPAKDDNRTAPSESVVSAQLHSQGTSSVKPLSQTPTKPPPPPTTPTPSSPSCAPSPPEDLTQPGDDDTPRQSSASSPRRSQQPKRRRIILDDSDDSDAEAPPSQSARSTPAAQKKPDAVQSLAARFAAAAPPPRRRSSPLISNKAEVEAEPTTQPEPSPPSSEEEPRSDGSFDFGRCMYGATPAGALPGNKKARKKLLGVAPAEQVGQEAGGWCERHPWSTDIRDAKKRSPGEPGYDPTTLYVPRGVLEGRRGTKDGGLSPFQVQFWEIKAANYNTLIFFKKGKFYELYDVDADVGHRDLGLNYTKGGRVDMRCCGVPEQAFEKHTARLLDLGHRIGQVEQVETANAAEKRKGAPGKTSAVCKRMLLRIITRATAREEAFLRDHRSRYLCAIAEKVGPQVDNDKAQKTPPSHKIGVAFVDVASGSISLQQFEDDFRLSKTERLISVLAPQEFVVDLSQCSQRLKSIVTWTSRKHDGRIDDLSGRNGMKPMTPAVLGKYLSNNLSTAQSKAQFERVQSHMEQFEVSCNAFGGLTAHLKSLIIDKETLSLANYKLHPDPFPGDGADEGTEGETTGATREILKDTKLGLDAATMQNLEILTSSNGSEKDSLLSFVDRARTPAGRRLIRKWVSEPLVHAADIEDRLQAVDDIHKLEDFDCGKSLRSVITQLKTKKDLERALPKLHQFATIANNAVMFDDTNRRRVKDFMQILRSVQNCLHGMERLAEAMESVGPKSKRLQWLYTQGEGIPTDALDKLDFFLEKAFDTEAAESEGEVKPARGAIPEFDEARESLDQVEASLGKELQKWQSTLSDRSIKFYHRGKEPYQIEVSQKTLDRCGTPSEFEVVSESKSVQRFYTRNTRKLVREHVDASECFEEASNSVARRIVRRFTDDYSTWSAVISACAELDALIGLANASRTDGSGPMCRPTILPDDHPHPQLSATALRHPILASRMDAFVANDVSLGGGDGPELEGQDDSNSPHAMILTGPNAGGKSTLARQVALAAVVAQIGCFVPAQSFTLRPFADVMVRMGASDDMARGRSTFMVEMEEVANMLNRATHRSLVIADEVGRGTSTHDGYAVAYAALRHLLHTNRALTIFSTHYTQLAAEIENPPSTTTTTEKHGTGSDAEKLEGRRVAAYEMAAAVDEKQKQITFLFKLQRGATTNSRGIYCARVASIPQNVADDAEVAAERFGAQLSLALDAVRFRPMLDALAADPAAYLRSRTGCTT